MIPHITGHLILTDTSAMSIKNLMCVKNITELTKATYIHHVYIFSTIFLLSLSIDTILIILTITKM